MEKGERGVFRPWLQMHRPVITMTSIQPWLTRQGNRRVQDVTNLALLAPDVLDGIATGEQPDGFTMDYLIKTRFSAVWSEQREQFAAL